MALVVLYPQGHKRAGQRKDAKDLTKREREDVDAARFADESRKNAHAEAILFGLGDARRTVLTAQQGRKA